LRNEAALLFFFLYIVCGSAEPQTMYTETSKYQGDHCRLSTTFKMKVSDVHMEWV
jgi:hypothetical protein